MQQTMTRDITKEQAAKDKWIPRYFVLFFLVLILVDGTFVYLATSSHRGVVTDDPYYKSLRYNETIAAADSQKALGWSGVIQLQENHHLRFQLKNADGEWINDAAVVAYFKRVTQDGYDFKASLDCTGQGHYQQQINFPLDGLWEVRIVSEWKQQQYQTRKRLIVQ